MKKSLIYTLVLIFIGCNTLDLCAQDAVSHVLKVKGKVYWDKNENQKFDKGDKGLKKVLISNGIDIISTQSDGSYEIMATAGQSVFPILPEGYRLATPNSPIGNANFAYLDKDSLATYANKEFLFGLIKENQPSTFKIGAIGDVQVDNDEELDFASRSIFKELSSRRDLAFNMFLGDQVNDKMHMMPKIKKVMNTVETTSWTMVGNHDRNTKNQTLLEDVFNRHFGAATYSFNYGGVHFVVLNNVYPTGKNSYEGRVSEDQIAFLKNDLAQIPTSKTVVISQHIPMAFTRNRAEIFDILKPYQNVLILTGHTHQVRRHIYPQTNIQELGVGATCGNWWTGEQDIDGIPQALMQCGTPRGYFTIAFNKGQYTINYKAVGLDPNKQIGLFLEGNKLVANIYGGSDSTKVIVNLGAGEFLEMSKVRRIDPLVSQIIAKNKNNNYPTEGNRRNPLGRKESSHIWEVELPESSDKGVKKIQIKAVDNYGFCLEQEHYITL